MRDSLAWRLAFGVTTPSTNTVTVAAHWHACRMDGIDDKLYGYTQLFSRF